MSDKFDELFDVTSSEDEKQIEEEKEHLNQETKGVKVERINNEEVYDAKNHRIIEDIEYNVPVKKQRKKIEMTPERKQRLLENLKKGRETARKNRQKRSEYNKILKEKERKKIDDVLEEDYKRRYNKKNVESENERLSKEIEELKKKLSFFTDKKDVEKLKKELNLVDDKKELQQVKKEINNKMKEEENVTTNISQKPTKIISSRVKKGSIWKL
tara:strand:+ start:363 stop:1004 length:642 start_codon:yes stop_codon:yes gene_type:complete